MYPSQLQSWEKSLSLQSASSPGSYWSPRLCTSSPHSQTRCAINKLEMDTKLAPVGIIASKSRSSGTESPSDSDAELEWWTRWSGGNLRRMYSGTGPLFFRLPTTGVQLLSSSLEQRYDTPWTPSFTSYCTSERQAARSTHFRSHEESRFTLALDFRGGETLA